MVSTTSGTTNFTLDVDDLLEEALESVGGDYTNAIEQTNARRTLNLLLIELQNKNVPLNKIGNVSVTLTNTDTYTLPVSVSDTLECVIKNTTNNLETSITRIGLREYHQIPDKTQTADRPTSYLVERGSTQTTVTFWPVPKGTIAHTAEFLCIKKIEDVTASYQKIDLPARYYPLVVSWLSYKLSLKRQGIDPVLRQELKQNYLDIMMDTFDEDRERVDFIIVPGGITSC